METYNGQLDQQFFDHQLASACSLNRLVIKGDKEIKLNLEFTNKITNLITFKTDQELNLTNAFNFFNRLRRLKEIEFKVSKNDVHIQKSGKDRYCIYDFDQDRWSKEMKFIKLIRWCYNLKNSIVTKSKRMKI